MFNGGCAACNKYDGVIMNPSAKRNRKTTETKHRNGRDNGEKPINTVPPQAAEMLEKTKAALDEFIKIKPRTMLKK